MMRLPTCFCQASLIGLARVGLLIEDRLDQSCLRDLRGISETLDTARLGGIAAVHSLGGLSAASRDERQRGSPFGRCALLAPCWYSGAQMGREGKTSLLSDANLPKEPTA
jgi:hypothetical protein